MLARAALESLRGSGAPWRASVINPRRRERIIESAALAHLGERQTEVHFMSSILCDFWRYCVRSTEAALIFIFYFLLGMRLFQYACSDGGNVVLALALIPTVFLALVKMTLLITKLTL
jgi:hypothetical protein